MIIIAECWLCYLVISHVFGVPVTLQPVLWSIFLHKITDTIAEVIGFEEKKLNDEITDLSFITLMTSHGLQENTQPSMKNISIDRRAFSKHLQPDTWLMSLTVITETDWKSSHIITVSVMWVMTYSTAGNTFITLYTLNIYLNKCLCIHRTSDEIIWNGSLVILYIWRGGGD